MDAINQTTIPEEQEKELSHGCDWCSEPATDTLVIQKRRKKVKAGGKEIMVNRDITANVCPTHREMLLKNNPDLKPPNGKRTY